VDDFIELEGADLVGVLCGINDACAIDGTKRKTFKCTICKITA
jgi:hypothetical protein